MQKIVLVLALLLSAPVCAFNAVYDHAKNVLSINGLEYRRAHYDIDLINVGDFVFVIDNISVSEEATTAYYDNNSSELVAEVLYNNDVYKIVLKNRGDFTFALQETEKMVLRRHGVGVAV